MNTRPFVNVALGIPKEPFTYRVPEALQEKMILGARVRVPFRNELLVGIAVSFPEASEQKNLKPVEEVLDGVPILSEELQALGKWISEYYFCSLGEALEHFLPKLLRQGRKVDLAPLSNESAWKPEKFEWELTQEQQQVTDVLRAALNAKKSRNFLLQGVTGSGKTEIYLRLMVETLQKGRSVICLVPEIALTHQLTRYFEAHLGATLEIFHSRLTDVERLQAWLRVCRGEKRVVLGARSALFSPLQKVGLILMDEEHDNSYKQEEVPRYHARECAEKLATLHGAVFLMGTATPSLESRFASETGRFELLNLKERVAKKKMPHVQIVDLKNEMSSGGNLLISRPLLIAIKQALAAKESILLFLNRRGFSSFLLCMDCGQTCLCRSCKVSLTYHASFQKMLCHYCNFQMPPPEMCPHCQSRRLKYGGVGTEKVEKEVNKLFPEARVERLDTDRIKKRGEAALIINRFLKREVDILIGTQMLAKGFHFPEVTLVGVIQADGILSLPDFRAFERGFQLLTQVAGRTGRGSKEGKVIVQTFLPDNYAVQYAKRHDYESFYSKEMETRKDLNYPPACFLTNVIIRSKNEAKVKEVCESLSQFLEKFPPQEKESLEWIGPAPLPFYKLRGYFRWHLMIKSPQNPAITAFLSQVLGFLSKHRLIYIAIDRDPVSIL